MGNKEFEESRARLIVLVQELSDEELSDLSHFIKVMKKDGGEAAWEWALSKCKPESDPDIQHD